MDVQKRENFLDLINNQIEIGKKIEENKWFIPKHLCNPEFRFIKIEKKNLKKPLEVDWQGENNYNCTNKELILWIKEGNNYGVVGGYGNLFIIDFDNKEFENKYSPLLPETFSVQTGSGGTHLYYLIDDPVSFKILDKNKDTLADLQGKGKQVIGPGSIHKSGNHYKVLNDVPIAKITLKAIKIIFSEYIITEEHKLKNEWDNDNIVQKIKNKVKLTTLLSEYNYNISINPTSCKLGHNSKGGKCFSFSDSENLWHCFHCEAGGDIFSFIMKHENCDFVKAKEILIEKAGLNSIKNEVIKITKTNSLKEDVFTLIICKEKSKAIQLMVDYILNNKYIYTTRDDERAEMWIYINGVYVPQGRTYLKEFCLETLGLAYNKNIVNSVIDKVEVETYIDQREFFINEDVNLVPVLNGILNIKTHTLNEFSPKYRFFNKLPVIFDPNIDCPIIKNFCKEVLLTEGDINVIQEMFGYLLYRDYKIEKAFMFHGSGRNGKSKMIELMKRFIGVENCANITLQSLDKDSFAMGELFNKMANLSADLPYSNLTETGNFKSLTGHDFVSAPRKFLNRVHFVNYAKMIFSANELPKPNDSSDAFFLRWVVIDFPYTFLSKKEMELDTKNKCKLANKSIIEQISTEEELSGLLNWALIGLNRLLEQGDFSYAKGAEEVKKHWLRKANSAIAFIQDCLVAEYGARITKQDLITSYWMYCKENGLEPIENKEFTLELTKRMPVVIKRDSTLIGNPQSWEGIKFAPGSAINEKLDNLNKVGLYD